jgi:hypothetical protein
VCLRRSLQGKALEDVLNNMANRIACTELALLRQEATGPLKVRAICASPTSALGLAPEPVFAPAAGLLVALMNAWP